jgi:DNA-binding response OmpR family regulator
MKAALVLLLSGDSRDEQLLNEALTQTSVRVVTISAAMRALTEVGSQQPALVLIGSGIPRSDAQWLLTRMMADSALRGIPVVLMFYESKRSWVLEMIKLGLRAYIQLPRDQEDLRRRLAQHLPQGTLDVGNQAGRSAPRGSVGERLRQRLAKRQIDNATAKASSSADPDFTKPITLLEQQYSDESGLMVRTSSREISLFQKIDEYLLRYGGNNSHVVGIFMGLLVDGKIRVTFKDKSERLSLVELSDKKSSESAIRFIDAYLNQVATLDMPDTRTQKIIL